MLQFLIILTVSIRCFGLPDCPGGGSCPVGGLWSEWVSSGSSYCQTTCGSCSKLMQTRQCVSDQFQCPCTGDSNRSYPCNTLACTYVAQRTCCIPYIAMKINGSLHCGPFEQPDYGSTACCKPGGVWTDWSQYSTTDDGSQWVRTRDCLSAPGGCPCTGADSESKGAQCPCPAPQDLLAASFFEPGTGPAEPGRAFHITNNDCTAIQFYNRSDYTPYTYCRVVDGVNVLQVRLRLADNSLITVTPGECDDGYYWSTQLFTCDLTTLNWIYGATNQAITGTAQINFAS